MPVPCESVCVWFSIACSEQGVAGSAKCRPSRIVLSLPPKEGHTLRMMLSPPPPPPLPPAALALRFSHLLSLLPSVPCPLSLFPFPPPRCFLSCFIAGAPPAAPCQAQLWHLSFFNTIRFSRPVQRVHHLRPTTVAFPVACGLGSASYRATSKRRRSTPPAPPLSSWSCLRRAPSSTSTNTILFCPSWLMGHGSSSSFINIHRRRHEVRSLPVSSQHLLVVSSILILVWFHFFRLWSGGAGVSIIVVLIPLLTVS